MKKAEEEARIILEHLAAQNRALAAIYDTINERIEPASTQA